MPMYDLYSKRKGRAAKGDEPEVFQYDILPDTLRTQLRQILTAAIGAYRELGEFSSPPNNNEAWEAISSILCRELGIDSLGRSANPYRGVMQWIETSETDAVLDVVELCCRWIARVMTKKRDYDRQQLAVTQEASEALREVNYRFREAGVGYEFVSGEIIRIDSQLIHAEVVKPALSLLRDPRFRGAEEEFLDAYSHYRSGRPKEAVTSANSAFESTMKAICEIKGWDYAPGSRASDLIKVLRKNNLLPAYLDNSFDQLAATLASGLPQVRNNDGGHGQGATPKETPAYIASYALHLCAANIVLMVDAALGKS